MAIDDFRALRLIPSWDVRYFSFTDRIVAEETTPEEMKADRDLQAEERLGTIFRTVGYNDEARKILGTKGGANYYVSVLDVIGSMVHDSGDIVVADVRNEGAIPDLPPGACAEIPARVGADGPVALPVGPLPLAVRGLIPAVKAYES